MPDVDVVIASYGEPSYWEPFVARAHASIDNAGMETGDGCIIVHDEKGTDLSAVRNRGARESEANWLIFLDADDELGAGYVAAMRAAEGDIRQPSTLGVHPDGHEDDYPVLIPPVPGGLLVGNHLVVGCMVRRSLFNEVGGFREGLAALEDWDLWIRCHLVGAVVGTAPDAIYRIHVRPASRNSPDGAHHQAYGDIQRRYQQQWQQSTS